MSVVDTVRRSAESGVKANTAALNAPLFRSVIDRMNGGGRWVVLDLGPAGNGTVSLFGQFRCRLEIADIATGIDALNAEDDPARLVDSMLPPQRDELVDIVLCWDILNYLNRASLRALMDGVARRCHAGSLMHALIVYSAPRMSAQPGRFVPTDEGRTLNVSGSVGQVDAPRYSPEDLSVAMPRFTVERAMLLRNGMQEFLFRM